MGAEAALDTEGVPNLLLLGRRCRMTWGTEDPRRTALGLADPGHVVDFRPRQGVRLGRNILAQEG